MEALAHPGLHLDGPHRPPQERFKGAFPEKVRHVQNAQGIPQIRFVRAELHHGLSVTHDRIGSLRHCRAPGREFPEHCAQHLLPGPEHVLLGGETHLKVQLVELSRGAVGPGVLVPEAGRYLKILVDARHHQQLLVLLRRLGQCIELTLKFPGWHNIVPCALRRGSAEDGGLYLHEAHLRHLLSRKSDHFRTK